MTDQAPADSITEKDLLSLPKPLCQAWLLGIVTGAVAPCSKLGGWQRQRQLPSSSNSFHLPGHGIERAPPPDTTPACPNLAGLPLKEAPTLLQHLRATTGPGPLLLPQMHPNDQMTVPSMDWSGSGNLQSRVWRSHFENFRPHPDPDPCLGEPAGCWDGSETTAGSQVACKC